MTRTEENEQKIAKMFLEDMIERIPKTKSNFACQRCSSCCRCRGDLELTPMDMIMICKYLNMSVEKVLEEFVVIGRDNSRRKVPYIKARDDAMTTCIFLDEGDNGVALCRIHEVKPIQCYMFPFIQLIDGTFLQQRCTVSGVGGEEREIEKIIESNSKRYKSEKDLMERYLNLLEEIDYKLLKCSGSRANMAAERIFEAAYRRIDVDREDTLEYMNEVLDHIEDTIIFM